jgi:hypothetical protein
MPKDSVGLFIHNHGGMQVNGEKNQAQGCEQMAVRKGLAHKV